MKPILIISILAGFALAQVPAQDSRNVNPPNAKTQFQMPVYKTLVQWEARAAHLRKQILSAAGLLPLPERTPLHPQIFGRLERTGYSVEKVLLETLPGFYLGGNIYRPLGKSGKFPAVATPHGHWTYGRLENTPAASVPGRCINLARQGYVVLSYDMIGYNDTIQTPHHFQGQREALWSFGPLGLQLWNSMRVIDFLQSLPEVDPGRIGVTGAASGGGTQTLMVMAVDPRVTVAAPANSTYMTTLECENPPGLRLGTFNAELAALMAPRPLLLISASMLPDTPVLISGTGDWFPAVRSVYELYGKADCVESVQVDDVVNYNQQSREAMYRFFGKHMLGETNAARLAERKFQVEQPRDLLVLHNRKLPDNALTYSQLLEQWINAAKKQNEASDREALRERLTYALAADWPVEVLSQMQDERIVLSRRGKSDRVPGIWLPARGAAAAALVVHPQGAEAARHTAEVRALIGSGRSVLMIDAYQTGAAVEPRAQPGEQYLVFNKSDAANRVQDILTALAFLQQSGISRISLTGLKEAAVWAVFAAAVAKTPVALQANLTGFKGDDRDYIDRFFVPGIQRAGGLRAALRLAQRHGF
jgi:dienelactone hydrolase